jgi:hypothetical protein
MFIHIEPDERHAEPLREHGDVEAAIRPVGVVRQRHAHFALACALGLHAPPGTGLELSSVDCEIGQ